MSNTATNLDPAPMLLKNAVNRCQAKARAPAHALRSEKRFKNMTHCRRVHARARVGNTQANKSAHACL